MKITTYLSALALAFTACNSLPSQEEAPASNPPSYNTSFQDKSEERLRNATKITIDEEVINLGKDYDILVDGDKLATVSGENLKLWNDEFVLKTIDGKILASEREDKRIVRWNRAAAIYNGNGTLSGYLTEETIEDMFSFGYIFHFLNTQQQEVGKSQKVGRGAIDHHKLEDVSGNADYDVDHKFTFIGDKYVLTVLNKGSKIPLEQAILLVCIEDTIKDAQIEKEKEREEEEEKERDNDK